MELKFPTLFLEENKLSNVDFQNADEKYKLKKNPKSTKHNLSVNMVFKPIPSGKENYS